MTNADFDRDKLMDHDYDGIKEYDNPMPGWWVWIFVVCVLFSFPYIMWYHLGEGPSVEEQYEAELAAFAAQLLETYGTLEPDEATILKYMDDDVAMTGMGSLFKSKCAQCHLADGGGNIGPNLTDDHWLNIKAITDLPAFLEAGKPEKGMPAWGGQLTQTQIVLLSSYVARLRRAPVPGKAPQGDVIPPWPTAPASKPEPEPKPKPGAAPGT